MKAKNEKTISFYIHQKEYQHLQEKLANIDMSVSSYIRELILNTDYIKCREEFAELLEGNRMLLENMQRIGANINQIARALNMNIKQSDDEILIVMNSLKKLLNDYKNFVLTSKKPKLLGKRKFQ